METVSDIEARQIRVVDPTIILTVNVAREEFLHVESEFVVKYQKSAAQTAWKAFIADVSKKLGIEFLEVILDRKDLSQVHYTLSLRQGGHYLARQRESSSVLETLNSGETPAQVRRISIMLSLSGSNDI